MPTGCVVISLKCMIRLPAGIFRQAISWSLPRVKNDRRQLRMDQLARPLRTTCEDVRRASCATLVSAPGARTNLAVPRTRPPACSRTPNRWGHRPSSLWVGESGGGGLPELRAINASGTVNTLAMTRRAWRRDLHTRTAARKRRASTSMHLPCSRRACSHGQPRDRHTHPAPGHGERYERTILLGRPR